MRRHGQPQALSVRAHLNGPLDLKLTARGRRAYLAVPNEQAIMPSQKLRQAHCREGVEALPPRRSAAGAAGRPPERSRGAAPRGLIYMLSPHHSKLAHVPSVRRPDFITPGLHANRRLQARWPDLYNVTKRWAGGDRRRQRENRRVTREGQGADTNSS